MKYIMLVLIVSSCTFVGWEYKSEVEELHKPHPFVFDGFTLQEETHP